MSNGLRERFARQFVYLGKDHERIASKKIAIVGCGGTGSHVALLCAQLGFGGVTVFDGDTVEESNLNRLALMGEDSRGKNKALEAARLVKRIDSDSRVSGKPFFLNEKNIGELKGADFVLDCSDNFQARRLVNRFCLEEEKPWVYAGAVRSEVMITTIIPGKTPCFECWAKHPGVAPSCRTVGVIAPAPVLAASVQAGEAVNLALGKPAFAGKLFYADLSKGIFGEKGLSRRSDCVCK